MPTEGGAWRGLSDPPTTATLVVALLLGVVGAALLSRFPPPARKPVLFLSLAGAPLIPVLTGRLPVLLVFQGPVLVLVLSAVGMLVVFRLAAFSGAHPRALPGALVFAAALAYDAWLADRLPGAAGPQGDEPQYLALAHSLLTDGDMDLTDEFERGEYAAFFAGRLRPHFSPSSPPGKIHSVHSPGLAFLILPAYALGGYAGVRLFLCLLAALAGLLVYRLAREALRHEGLAAAVWASMVFTPPLPIYAMRVYPETPAVLATAAFLLTSRGRPRPGAVATAALLAAALPWLHSKLLPLAALGLLLTLLRPCRWRLRAAAVAVFAASLALLLALFHALYGQASFSAAYGTPDFAPGRLPRNTAALLFDRQFGLLAVAPLWALALPGAVALFRWRTGDALRALLLAAPAILIAGSFVAWWGGACPPARYVLPALPALALAAGPAFRQRGAAAAVLAGVGLGVMGLAAEAPRILNNRIDGESLLLRFLSPSVDANGFLPSFFEQGPAPVLLACTLGAAGALAWRWGTRGLVGGAAAFLAVSASLHDRPLVDRRLATQQLLWAWEPGRLRGPHGPVPLAGLRLPLELPRRPWVLQPLQVRTARRVELPPGLYRLELGLRPHRPPPGEVKVEMRSGPLLLADAVLDGGRPVAALPLLLPAGVRRMELSAAGVAGRAELAEARIAPEELIPRTLRGEFYWPLFAEPGRYRVPAGVVRVTALDRSAPEGDGFRLHGPQGAFLLDGPPAVPVDVQIQRPRPAPTDALWWGSRRIPLGLRPQVVLRLPLEGGASLGPAVALPVRVRSGGAWARFASGPPTSPGPARR